MIPLEYREVPVYDGEFPSIDQMLTGGPDRPAFPKEVWLQQVQPGEIAVRFKNFKSDQPWSLDGRPAGSSEKCRVFPNVASAEAGSREIVAVHPAIVCVLYSNDGREVRRIHNTRFTRKFAFAALLGFLAWGTIYAAAGMACLWLLYWIVFLGLRALHPGLQPIRSLPWYGWIAFVVCGLLLSTATWWLRASHRVKRRVGQIRGSFSAEGMDRFAEVNNLHATRDPVERERLLKLYREYQERLREAAKRQ